MKWQGGIRGYIQQLPAGKDCVEAPEPLAAQQGDLSEGRAEGIEPVTREVVVELLTWVSETTNSAPGRRPVRHSVEG